MPRLKHNIYFSDGKTQWKIPVTREFNCHAEDKTAVFRELMKEEIKPRWPKDSGFVTKIELVKI